MDLSKYLGNVSLFVQLAKIDSELEKRKILEPCPHCGHNLHRAPYERKPRGALCELLGFCFVRLSLCCGHCRKRCLPLSCVFLGRKVYYGCVILLLTAILQGLTTETRQSLCDNLGVSRRTLGRWLLFFRDTFPNSPLWKVLRGLLSPPIAASPMPLGLFQADLSLISICCLLMGGISPTSVSFYEGPSM